MVRSTILFAASIAATCQAFAPTSSFVGRSNTVATCAPKKSTRSNGLKMQVIDITSEAAFDNTLSSASDSLVIVDYSTTWCGPCKVIKPVFDQMSENYPDAIFLQVIGDASADASKLMKREGVRSVPSFHFFRSGQKLDVVNGANAEAIEAAITKHLRA
mmetsp:Transcript_7726/g.11396  ORF Transcript_7726/g.11396 Transcript_7726/m.11396 type:complete len:159 (+) Transcript_7726:105-581(+)|eukprot:CAMPEP_0196811604 /NCGR_PEP_ID=MMETSP1362-20130617/19025_1 /TAXON_ID=163516 /ORGANISM="Leptocylindrus danicus, Strain CCMP1856" /LENGTH=158 /DNA_ID=CAMNT_0042186949 /DNA_START=89 /DNA_END=565 /DNA_ORIENTATION=+